MTGQKAQALERLRILDLATFYAGPVAATNLGDFGAEVIKVEMPGLGDNTRSGPGAGPGLGLLWLQEGRNKKSVTLNLQKPEGRQILKKLVAKADALIDGFRPGTMEEWGLGPEVLLEINPRLVILRISGYGQTGPYRHKGAFDRTAQAFAGSTYVTGFPDSEPVRAGFAIADYSAAFVGTYALMIALYWRDARGGRGQVIDLALYEPMLRASESAIPAYDKAALIRERSGNKNPGAVPAGNFLAKDGGWVVLNALTDRLWQRLSKVMGKPELGSDPRYATVMARIENEKEVYRYVEEWVAGVTVAEALQALDEADVPAAKINTVADLFEEPHIKARENIVRVPDPRIGDLAVPGVMPKMSLTPGTIRHLGVGLGEHNEAIYMGELGLSKDELAELEAKGVI